MLNPFARLVPVGKTVSHLSSPTCLSRCSVVARKKTRYMRDSRINFRSRELAALLAYLIPGAGHYYQGRMLKAKIYFFGILSLFFGGMVLGDWQPIYYASSSQPMEMLTESEAQRLEMNGWSFQSRRKFVPTMGYPTQFFLGVASMPAMIQRVRLDSDPGVVESLDGAIDSPFTGALEAGNQQVFVEGRLQLASGGGSAVSGVLTGKTRRGEDINMDIRGSIRLGRKVYGSPRRHVEIALRDAEAAGMQPTRLAGKTQRAFVDWFQAPPDNDELDRLHGKLSQNFDIACVFTWIAGLLNLMAIWDAYDGPAYGYGDEDPDEDEDNDDKAKEK